MTQVLSPGPPPLTDDAADAAIDGVDYMAAAVYGVDSIDVTDAVRASWARMLAESYPALPPPARFWFATAPEAFALMRAQFPLLGAMQRAALLQQWAVQVPSLVQMILPAFEAAQSPMSAAVPAPAAQPVYDPITAQALRELESDRHRVEAIAQSAPNPSDTDTVTTMSSQEAIDELNRRAGLNVMIQNGTTGMVSNTIDLLRAMSPR